MNKLLILVAATLPLTSYAIDVSSCINSSGSYDQDQTIARAVAKGRLSQELGATVSATTNLESKTTESAGAVTTKDTLTNSITLSSQHYVSGVKVLREGYEFNDGKKQYCVHLTND